MISISTQEYMAGWDLAVETLKIIGINQAPWLLCQLSGFDNLTYGCQQCLETAAMNGTIPDKAIASFF